MQNTFYFWKCSSVSVAWDAIIRRKGKASILHMNLTLNFKRKLLVNVTLGALINVDSPPCPTQRCWVKLIANCLVLICNRAERENFKCQKQRENLKPNNKGNNINNSNNSLSTDSFRRDTKKYSHKQEKKSQANMTKF